LLLTYGGPLTSFSLPLSELSLVRLALDMVVLRCYDTVVWVIWPVKSSPKWPIMCRVGRYTLPYHTIPSRGYIGDVMLVCRKVNYF